MGGARRSEWATPRNRRDWRRPPGSFGGTVSSSSHCHPPSGKKTLQPRCGVRTRRSVFPHRAHRGTRHRGHLSELRSSAYTARTRVCTALPSTLVFSGTLSYVLLSLWPHSALFRERSLLFHGVMYDKQEYRYWTREIIALQRRNEIKILAVPWARGRAPRGRISI